jgi:outer membrane immunogenic protein
MGRKGFLLATASGMAAAATSGAQAADMPTKAIAPAPAAASWAGWYIGLNGGSAWQHSVTNSSYFETQGTSQTTEVSSLIGGGQIGYNWQNGNYVYGVEADISGLTGTGSTQDHRVGEGKITTNKIKWLSTLRTRQGLAIGDTLLYMTGGLAIAGVNNTSTFCNTGFPCTKSESKTKVGWTAGFGVDHMFTPNFTIGADLLFVDLGESTVTLNGTNGPKTSKFHNTAVISRLKANLKF